ncbi:uncharacterized protein LOC131638517 [Vicia villosa]|uniref:uncharacterized protein LOC131638517 n=1 Tax=Vicia villosa TaxID=3911 RepID=UPI00273C2516|nr:uncharacterized protein LOC131638517 [Vicia villosa]
MLETIEERKKQEKKDGDEVKYAHAGDSYSEDVILMENTQSSNEQTKTWHLDSGCSNHMTGNKNWFTKLDESVKKVIKFADGRHVRLGGKGNIYVVRNDGRKANIIDMLYVPLMTSNLITIDQLLAKGYNLMVEKNQMKV